MDLFHATLRAFIPIFVAVDAIAILPMFVSLTGGISQSQKNRIVMQSVITALCLAIGFVFLGKAVFRVLSVTIPDFMVAGGLVLLCISVKDILIHEKHKSGSPHDLGAVPIGTPLIVGPAVLTTSLIIVPVYGITATLISLVVNIVLAGVMLRCSHMLLRVLGEGGGKAVSKIASLLLAAIAVMMMRKGIAQMILGQ